MKAHSHQATQDFRGTKHWPFSLALSIALSIFWAWLLVQSSNPRGSGAGRLFLTRVASDPDPGHGANGAIPVAFPSPTLYVPNAPKAVDGYLPLSFTDLSGFFFWNPIDYADGDRSPSKKKQDQLRSKVPGSVMAYDGKKVAITGFMIPVDEDEKFMVKGFILAKSQMTCCYGATPLPNEWLYATLAPNASKVPEQMDVPLTVFGTLSIDPQLKDQSMPTLYKMTVTKVEGPQKNWF